jgi:hypothetical protein
VSCFVLRVCFVCLLFAVEVESCGDSGEEEEEEVEAPLMQ